LTFEAIGTCKMDKITKLTLYETTTRLYLVGACGLDRFKIAKVDRTSPEVSFIDDHAQYSRAEVEEVLVMINNGNKSTGGLRKLGSFEGIFGFVRFLEGPYLILVSKKSPVALLGGYTIYHVDDTFMYRIAPGKDVKKVRRTPYLIIQGRRVEI
jgi:hypothetical protein